MIASKTLRKSIPVYAPIRGKDAMMRVPTIYCAASFDASPQGNGSGWLGR